MVQQRQGSENGLHVHTRNSFVEVGAHCVNMPSKTDGECFVKNPVFKVSDVF